MPWRIEFEGEVYREGDLTLGQVGQVERLLEGRSWLHIHPVRYAQDAVAVLAVMVAARKGETLETLLDRIGNLKPAEYLNILKIEDDDDLPVEFRDGFPPPADEPSTGT